VNANLLAFLIFSFASAVFAEDFKTVNGKEYKDATISRIEPDGIVVKTKSGITKVYFAELPKELQERFHYDPQQATTYSATQSADYATYQKQQEQNRREQEEAAAKDQAILAKQQAVTNRIQALQQRYDALQRDEDALLQQIVEAKKPGPAYWGGSTGRTMMHYPNPQRSQLPYLQTHLSDVRQEMKEVRKQLEKSQR
jgi:hypothetical protein